MYYSPTKVVCFGGGTGLPGLLSGLKHNPWLELTAVVNMFDTGGSSGELRDRFGILPPGDILKCLLGLSKHEAYARELLLKRICNPDSPGHTGGNVLLLGLEKVYNDYPAAIDHLGEMLSIRGKVVPVTLKKATLCALYDDDDGFIARGETSIDIGIHEGKSVAELFLEPFVVASPQALEAIEHADVFCIGPGSFYTSVLPNFLPNGVMNAIRTAHGKIIYIANLFTEGRGMKGMDLLDFVELVESYIGRKVDCVVANDFVRDHWSARDRYANENKYPVSYRPGGLKIEERCVLADLWTDPNLARHDCSRLAHLVSYLINLCKLESKAKP